MYDIIGDIHGHADKLIELLRTLGYRPKNGIWQHPTRQLISLGDLVDRGPQQRKVIDTLMPMQQAGHAQVIMGNHEFNAVAWATKDEAGQPLRANTAKNREQHQAFLEAAESDRIWYNETIEWFKSLPLLIEHHSFCCIHAAWDNSMVDYLKSVLTSENALEPNAWLDANTKGHPVYEAIEYCLKGPEIPLPTGHYFIDSGGKTRQKMRLKWWDLSDDATYQTAAVSVPQSAALPSVAIPQSMRAQLPQDKPIFFGHYWMAGEPRIQTALIACLDWSVVKDYGYLAAYRYDGETQLNNEKLVWV